LIALLIVIAAMGAALGAGGTLWHQVQMREKERELLFAGMQIRNAIAHYYNGIAGRPAYPPTLEALLLDERAPGVKRHLRRIYRDPLSNTLQWGLLTAPGGGIMGVYSLAPGVPIKSANFPAALGWAGTEEKREMRSYADWQFSYVPQAAR
jgi:type II secretory pathway pseudopilin PulG